MGAVIALLIVIYLRLRKSQHSETNLPAVSEDVNLPAVSKPNPPIIKDNPSPDVPDKQPPQQ